MSRTEQGLRANLEYNNGVKANTAFYDELKNKLPNFFTADKLDEFGAVKELGSFDLEKFKASLSENNINELTSGYQLDFIGKNYAKKQAGERPTTVIVPDNVHNEKSENKSSKNIFFSGDNLEVLRHLQQNYANSIDFIYIDPPYNTGSDGFVYPDNFDYSDDQLQDMFGLNSEELKRLKSIQGKSTHSAWLTFMYPRLYLAKKLLKDTGVIFVSIDDNEQANLKLLMDDVFGEGSFVANIVQKHRGGVSNDKIISDNHNYLLFYVRDRSIAEKRRSKFGIDRTENDYKNYKRDDGDGRGSYTLNPVTGPGGARKGNPFYEFLGVENYWRFSLETMKKMYEDGKIVKSKNTLYQKTYRKDMENKRKGATTWWENSGTTSSGTGEIKKLFNETVFDFPKPTKLVKNALKFSDIKNNAVVLDFFAGSSTTADAVMQLNAEDGGHRQFIMCTLPEPTYTTNSDGKEIPTKGGEAAYRAGFKSIDEISRERIIRASAKIKAENTNLSKDFDGGFKHYRVVPAKQETLDQLEFDDNLQLDMFDNMLDDFSSDHLGVTGQASGFDTILQTYLASDNYQFDVPMKMIDFGGIKVAYVNQQRIYIITDNWQSENTKALVNAIGTNQLAVQTIVVFGYPMAMESLRELKIALKQLENNVKVLVRY